MICLAVLVFVSAFQKPNLETSKAFSQSLGEEYGLEIESGPWLPKINHLIIDVQGRERLGTTLTHPLIRSEVRPLPFKSKGAISTGHKLQRRLDTVDIVRIFCSAILRSLRDQC